MYRLKERGFGEHTGYQTMSGSEQSIFGAGVGLRQTQDMEQMVTNIPLYE